MNKKILFVTGTRADYGKLKPLISRIINSQKFSVKIFVTGMHLLKKYGHTYIECEKDFHGYIDKFINQNPNDGMDAILGKTILGFSDYIHENTPDLIVIHGESPTKCWRIVCCRPHNPGRNGERRTVCAMR